jgi:hypothetical protein
MTLPAVFADGAGKETQDNVVARLHSCHLAAHALNHASPFVAQHQRKRHDWHGTHGKISMAQAGSDDPNQHLIVVRLVKF